MFYETITDIFKDSTFDLVINYRQLVDWGTYSPDTLKELQVFNEEHIFFNEFLEEVNKIDNKKFVNHNFHHLKK